VPVNALAAGAVAKMRVSEIEALGVRRISVGSQVARLTHAAIRDSVTDMLGEGTFARFSGGARGTEIDTLLERGAG
jgi:2-methylisocitrate lyase-like PEP mutase family enzyme